VTQKVIEVVGTSKESFAKAAEAAVKEAAKTVRAIKWAHIESFDLLLDGANVVQYRATAKIYFDVEH
jgi:dodecin